MPSKRAKAIKKRDEATEAMKEAEQEFKKKTRAEEKAKSKKEIEKQKEKAYKELEKARNLKKFQSWVDKAINDEFVGIDMRDIKTIKKVHQHFVDNVSIPKKVTMGSEDIIRLVTDIYGAIDKDVMKKIGKTKSPSKIELLEWLKNQKSKDLTLVEAARAEKQRAKEEKERKKQMLEEQEQVLEEREKQDVAEEEVEKIMQEVEKDVEESFENLRKQALKDIILRNKIPVVRSKSVIEKMPEEFSYNYCGSGTDIVSNLINNVKPKNDIDKACAVHDIQYMFIASSPVNSAQKKRNIRIADNALINKAKEIGGRAGPIVRSVMNAKIVAENQGIIDPLSYIGESKPLDLKTEEKIEDILGDDLPTVEERRLYREQVKEDKPTRETGVKFEEKEEVKTITTKKMRDEELVGMPGKDLRKLLKTGRITKEQYQEEMARRAAPRAKDEDDKEAEQKDAENEEDVTATTGINVDELIKDNIANNERQKIVIDKETAENKAMPAPADKAIIGERYMRTLAYRETGESVKPSDEQVQENKRWLENFTWIDPGFGNGNQERLPWNLGGGNANNRLYEAQQANEVIKYSGDLYDGGQEYRKKLTASAATRKAMEVPMIPTTQNRQRFIRNGALPAGLGRPIQMIRDTNDIVRPVNRIDDPGRRLLYPDIVDFERV